MKIYIINLKRSPARKKKFEAQIQQFSSSHDFIFFDAIDSKQQQQMSVWQPHQTKLAKILRGTPLIAGELACFASHYSLWQLCASTNEPIVVMEDDAILKPDFDKTLEHIAHTNYKYVKLKATNNKKQFELEPHFTITYQAIAGAVGYYLTPEASVKFINKAKKWSKPVDDYLDSFWIHRVPAILCKPEIIDYSLEIPSTIDDKRTKPTLMFKLIREFCRGLLEIRKFLFLRLYKIDNTSKIFE